MILGPFLTGEIRRMCALILVNRACIWRLKRACKCTRTFRIFEVCVRPWRPWDTPVLSRPHFCTKLLLVWQLVQVQAVLFVIIIILRHKYWYARSGGDGPSTPQRSVQSTDSSYSLNARDTKSTSYELQTLQNTYGTKMLHSTYFLALVQKLPNFKVAR